MSMSTNKSTRIDISANTNAGKVIGASIDRSIENRKEIDSIPNMQNNHIFDSQLESLGNGKIGDEDLIMLLEHAGQCMFCAERLGEAVEESAMSIMPPAYLKDQIREQIEQFDVIVDKKMRQTSKRLQLFFYSFRVAATVSLAILMLCVTSVFPITDMTKVEAARMERYQAKIERDAENLAVEYSAEGFFDEKWSVKDFLKENLSDAIDGFLDSRQ